MGFSPDASRISLPRGKIFFARKDSAGDAGPFLFLGNAPRLDFGTIGDDIAEVVDWTSSSSSPLTRISKKRSPEFPLTLMEANPDNLALVFMGAVEDYTQAAAAVTDEVLQGGIKVGAIYRTSKPHLNPTTPITTLETTGTTPTTLTENTHYVVRDTESGIIEVIALPAGAVEGDPIQATYTPLAISTALKKITGGDVDRIEGSLLYIGTGATGPRHKLEIWNCSIASDGTFPLIAADPVEFPLKVTVLADANHTDLFELLELDDGSDS